MSEMSTSVSARASKAEKPAEHKHPSGVRDEIVGVDDLGRRIIRTIPDRVATYKFDCKACQAEDKARMAAPPTDFDPDSTMFLIPENANEHDAAICRMYISQRYPEAKAVVGQFNAEKLAYVKDARIIVVTRRGKNGKPPGPSSRRMKDAEDVWVETPIPPETYLDEVVESAPIIVADCMNVVPATMFSDQSVDMHELTARLAERCAPRYRIAIPADKQDKFYAMRLNS